MTLVHFAFSAAVRTSYKSEWRIITVVTTCAGSSKLEALKWSRTKLK